MQRRYITVDVFTDRAFGGNPLAVVLDAGGLSTEQMQAIAADAQRGCPDALLADSRLVLDLGPEELRVAVRVEVAGKEEEVADDEQDPGGARLRACGRGPDLR